jgi:phosphoribosylformimino-5-aminoimidazole carboxamide ribonucleotide (ProFAR) isomerase
MQGTDMDAIRSVRAATSLYVTAAGGITTFQEIEYLDSIGVDAVVGMALYTGRLKTPNG